MLVDLTQAALNQLRAAVMAQKDPVEVSILTERAFYEMGDNEYCVATGRIVWCSQTASIVESNKWSGKNAKYYFVRYKDGIVLKLSCETPTMDRIIRRASVDPHSPASAYFDQCTHRVVKYLKEHEGELLELISSMDESIADPTMIVLTVDRVISAGISSVVLYSQIIDRMQARLLDAYPGTD